MEKRIFNIQYKQAFANEFIITYATVLATTEGEAEKILKESDPFDNLQILFITSQSLEEFLLEHHNGILY